MTHLKPIPHSLFPLLLLLAFGCSREAKEETPVEAPAAVAKAEAACRAVGRSMNELTEQVKAKLGTDDMSKVMAELRKTPEWKKLEAELGRRSEELAKRRAAAANGEARGR